MHGSLPICAFWVQGCGKGRKMVALFGAGLNVLGAGLTVRSRLGKKGGRPGPGLMVYHSWWRNRE
eukprot:351453-Chlamydomonas_euryale.AAC.1